MKARKAGEDGRPIREVGLVLAVVVMALAMAACGGGGGDTDGTGGVAGSGPPMPDAVGGVVWGDSNGNGEQNEEESALADMTVNVWRDVNGDGVCQPAMDAVVASEVTNSEGTFSFGQVEPGMYCIELVTDQPAVGDSVWSDPVVADGSILPDVSFGLQ